MAIDKICIFLNGVGVPLYLYLSSRLWAPNGQAGLRGGPGDPIVWGLTVLPILVVFCIINLIWLRSIFLRWLRTKKFSVVIVYLLVSTAWCSAIIYSNSRGFTGAWLIK